MQISKKTREYLSGKNEKPIAATDKASKVYY